MHIETPEVRAKIRRLVEITAYAREQHDDLTQEALIHLWRTECDFPSRSLSWYSQAIRFHVLHFLDRGRSVDALKRRHLVRSFDDTAGVNPLHHMASDMPTPFEHASARDLLHQLATRLDEGARHILHLLVQGHGVREVAAKVGLSHVAVLKHRGRIAREARRLGFAP